MRSMWKRFFQPFAQRGDQAPSVEQSSLVIESDSRSVIEPALSGIPDFELSVISGFEIGSFKVSVGMASSRGVGHFENRTARQDSMCAFQHKGNLIIGLSDGVSSSPNSDFASQLATQELPEVFRRVFAARPLTDLAAYFEINRELSQKIVSRHVAEEKKLGKVPNSDINSLRKEAAAKYAATLELVTLQPSSSGEHLELQYVRIAGDGGLSEISSSGVRNVEIRVEAAMGFGVSALPVCDAGPQRTIETCTTGASYLFATDGIAESFADSSTWLEEAKAILSNTNFKASELLNLVTFEPDLTADDRTFALIKVHKC
jgi:serine/threonine protein phosphatase PrpC